MSKEYNELFNEAATMYALLQRVVKAADKPEDFIEGNACYTEIKKFLKSSKKKGA